MNDFDTKSMGTIDALSALKLEIQQKDDQIDILEKNLDMLLFKMGE